MTSSLLYTLFNLLIFLSVIPWRGWLSKALMIISTVPLYTLTPRFVVNVRELYVLDTQGRVNRDIDTGFGLSSGVGHGVGMSTAIGTIAFAEAGGNRMSDDDGGVVTLDRVESNGGQALSA